VPTGIFFRVVRSSRQEFGATAKATGIQGGNGSIGRIRGGEVYAISINGLLPDPIHGPDGKSDTNGEMYKSGEIAVHGRLA
jgi:hypothetical protein